MKQIAISCHFCDESSRGQDLDASGVQRLVAAYLAHLVESHWDKLEQGRAIRLAADAPVNDAWTRL